MPVGAQPPHRRGTVGEPYSALNLRLALALFGLVFCTAAGVVFLVWAHVPGFGWFFIALAVIAAADAVVVQLRRRARARKGERGHSLFE
ncbi:MAG TPA: DUF6343 family protein [Micromonosporaceae bacterium]|jgi:hypothetical protein